MVGTEKRKQALEELAELEAWQWLMEKRDLVYEKIECLKQIHEITMRSKETNPTAITKESKRLTKGTVTDKVQEAFADELKALGLDRLSLKMSPTRGSGDQQRQTVAAKADVDRVRRACASHLIDREAFTRLCSIRSDDEVRPREVNHA